MTSSDPSSNYRGDLDLEDLTLTSSTHTCEKSSRTNSIDELDQPRFWTPVILLILAGIAIDITCVIVLDLESNPGYGSIAAGIIMICWAVGYLIWRYVNYKRAKRRFMIH